MVKTSSLAMLIGVVEVIKVGQQIIEHSLFSNQSAALWIYGVIFCLYFVICYPLSLFFPLFRNPLGKLILIRKTHGVIRN